MTQFPVCGLSQGRDIAHRRSVCYFRNRVAFCESKYFNQTDKAGKNNSPSCGFCHTFLLCKGKKIRCFNDVIVLFQKEPVARGHHCFLMQTLESKRCSSVFFQGEESEFAANRHGRTINIGGLALRKRSAFPRGSSICHLLSFHS